MNNAQLIANLIGRNIGRIDHMMKDLGYSYAEALRRAKAQSVGGPAVWDAVEAHYAKELKK